MMNGIEATRLALEEYPDLKIVALTMFDDEEYIQRMIDAGAKGFLLKNITKEILDQALQAVQSGQKLLFSRAVRLLHRKVVERATDRRR
ncbi:MAG: response regulator transcription factor [Ignavibacteriales bacterium]|nr:response regulator transcription factor [Ignavibacteriales bacterium]